MPTTSTRMSRAQIIGFVALAGPVTAATAPIASYLPAFYSEHLGLSLVSVGLVFFSMRALDFIFDLLAGLLIDRRVFASGKYRPWLALGVPVLMLGVGLLYVPPQRLVSVPLVFVSGAMLYLGFSFVSIAHQAWSSALSRSGGDMVAIFGYREVAVIVGIMGVFLAPAVAEQVFHADFEAKVHIMGYALLVTIALAGVCSLWSARGKDQRIVPGQVDTSEHAHRISLSLMGRILRDMTVIKVAVPFMLFFFGVVSCAAMMPFLVKNVFGRPDLIARMQGAYFIAAMASIFFWLWIAKRLGEWRVLRFSSLSAIVAQLSVLLPLHFGTTWALFVHFALIGVHFGAAPFLLRSLLGRIGSRMASELGADARGVLFSIGVFAEKIGGSLGVLLTLWALQWLGVRAGAGSNPAAHDAILSVYIALPIGAYALMSLIFLSGDPRAEPAETMALKGSA